MWYTWVEEKNTEGVGREHVRDGVLGLSRYRWEITLKWLLWQQYGKALTGLIWLRIREKYYVL
jgi:hypothetical protein